MKQGRGQLTPRIKERSKELLGKPLTLRQLRLLPYLQWVACNEHQIDPRKVNAEEYVFINAWAKEARLTVTGGHLTITKPFWDAMCEIIYLAYVDTTED